MSHEWIGTGNIKIPNELVIATGKVALAFSALQVAIAMILSQTSSSHKSFGKLCGMPLETLLNRLESLRTAKKISARSLPVERLRVLSRMRNDLMHGLALLPIEGPVEKLHLWNPKWKRASSVSADELTAIADEVYSVAYWVPYTIYDIINAPGELPNPGTDKDSNHQDESPGV